MDIGSADCVARSEMFPQVEREESLGSKAGQCWTTATNEKVTNEGQKTVHVWTEEGRNKKICWQIAPVHKAPVAVGKVCDQDNICVFGKRGGFIRSNGTGELTSCLRKFGFMCCGCGLGRIQIRVHPKVNVRWILWGRVYGGDQSGCRPRKSSCYNAEI